MLPNFIIAGAAKAGTTSLFHYLSEHPEIFMSNPKEVNFFTCKEIKDQKLYYDSFLIDNLESYKNLFSNASNYKAIGEGSVSSLFYKNTPKKIKNLIPDIKIIILLRNPIDRAFSHYLMDYKLGLINDSFDDIVFRKSNSKNLDLYFQQYLELGKYYNQIKRYLDIFNKDQVKIFLQEDLFSNTQNVVKEIYNFLNVDSSFIPKINKKHNAFSMPRNKIFRKIYSNYFLRTSFSYIFSSEIKRKLKKIFLKEDNKPKMSTKTKKYLLDFYLDDINDLENLIKKDLTNWK